MRELLKDVSQSSPALGADRCLALFESIKNRHQVLARRCRRQEGLLAAVEGHKAHCVLLSVQQIGEHSTDVAPVLDLRD